MKNIITEWNRIDSILFKVDDFINSFINKIKDLREAEPDVEYMIEVETNHLRQENEKLKKLQFPRQIKKNENNYICPNSKCGIVISNILVEQYNIKYCPECGQRVYKHMETSLQK